MSMLDDLYLPDGKKLTSMVVGRPGSGKSFYIKNTLKEFSKQNKDENLRIVYICPKQEMDLGEKTLTDAYSLDKHLQKNRIGVIYPNIDYIDSEVDYVIDTLFEIQQSNPKFKAVLVIDDAQIFITSRKSSSVALRRLALTGRSKGIRFVGVSHSVIFSKDLEGSTSLILNFTMPVKMFHRDFNMRYGFDPEPYIEDLANTEYSYVYFDVTTGHSKLMPPLEVKGSK